MTDAEIYKKIDAIKISEAPIEVREKAILELEARLSTNNSSNVAHQQLIDGAPDYDIDD